MYRALGELGRRAVQQTALATGRATPGMACSARLAQAKPSAVLEAIVQSSSRSARAFVASRVSRMSLLMSRHIAVHSPTDFLLAFGPDSEMTLSQLLAGDDEDPM